MKRFLFSVLASVILVACSDKPFESDVAGKFVFSADVAKLTTTKTTLNNTNWHVSWQSNDVISVFDGNANNCFTISKFGTGTSTFRGDNLAVVDYYYALYPYQAEATFDGTWYRRVTVPSSQTAQNGTFNKGANVQIAKTSKNDMHFYFKNVCAVLEFEIPSGAAVSEIIVGNTLSALAGTVDVKYDDLSLANFQSDVRCIKVLGTYTAGEKYYIAVLPGTYRDLYVSYKRGGYVYSRMHVGDVTISSNVVYDLGSLGSSGFTRPEFSVSPSQKVYFSKGNLQASCSSGWKFNFAEHQYDYIGANDGNTHQMEWAGAEGGYQLNGTVDLIGWTMGGSHPWGLSPLTDPHNIRYEEPWREFSSISAADVPTFFAGQLGANWRILSNDEWKYLLRTRPSASQKIGHANVAGVNGLIILPDVFHDPRTNQGNAFVPSNGSSFKYSNNTYGLNGDWEAMEAAGAAFLPAAGNRIGTYVDAAGSSGQYRTSTAGLPGATTDLGLTYNARDHGATSTYYTHTFYVDFGPDRMTYYTGIGVDYQDYNYRYIGASYRMVKNIGLD